MVKSWVFLYSSRRTDDAGPRSPAASPRRDNDPAGGQGRASADPDRCSEQAPCHQGELVAEDGGEAGRAAGLRIRSGSGCELSIVRSRARGLLEIRRRTSRSCRDGLAEDRHALRRRGHARAPVRASIPPSKLSWAAQAPARRRAVPPGTVDDRQGLKLLLGPAQLWFRRRGRGPERTQRHGAPQSGYARGPRAPAARRRNWICAGPYARRRDRHRRQRRGQLGGPLEQRIAIVRGRRRQFGEGERTGRRSRDSRGDHLRQLTQIGAEVGRRRLRPAARTRSRGNPEDNRSRRRQRSDRGGRLRRQVGHGGADRRQRPAGSNRSRHRHRRKDRSAGPAAGECSRSTRAAGRGCSGVAAAAARDRAPRSARAA